ncbi:MAG TPA: AAA family ATPase, partial [Polyangiales bacterium]
AFGPDIPKALDQLVLALLSREPLARPASAAEVIVRLNVIGQLPLEDVGERRRLAQSFLIVPPFVGRDEELAELNSHLKQACNGRGSAVRIEAVAGSGRSRLLEEVGVRAQLTGATVLRADASMHPNHHGTSRALAMRLLDALPDVAREYSRRYAHHLLALGRDIEALLGVAPLKPQRERDASGEPLTDPGGDLAEWFVDVSHHKPLVITVDNVEFCDAASLGVLVALSARARHESIFIVVAERTRRDRKTAKGLSVLREQCQTLALSNLAPSETLALARSLFGDAPNVERFAEFLHTRTAGSPLHCVEMSRQLIASEVIRHEGGMWILPASRPHVELPEALEGALSVRIANLGPQALALAQCLSMQRGEPTLALCAQLTEPSAQRTSEQEALVLLDELARNDVLLRDRNGYRFSSSALRDALVAGQDELEREACHTRLGKAFEHLAREAPRLLLEAGWHWMRGGDELRGADLIAYVLRDGASVRGLSANGYQLGPIADGALRIYKRHRRTAYERMPLLAAVAQAGYYEDHTFTDRFGDEALDVIEDLAGLRTARRLRRYCGGLLALAVGVGFAMLRFFITPKRERSYPFMEMFHNAFSTVAAMVGTATMSLDADRADRIARVLEPFSVLPEQTTARGIYDFCIALQQIGRERQPETFAVFDTLCRRMQEPGRFRLVPPDARPLFLTSAHFARGAFAIFRADGTAALESVAALEASGYTLYTMVASQLRFLYHANRGELAEAARQRELVELHAARSGSAWQVELWEPGALLPLYLALGDVVALSRI